jgi:hypothetical protein
MSAQTMAEVFAPVEARYHAQVLKETWGHLAPIKNRKYNGHITWALGCYGSDNLNPTILEAELKGSDGKSLDGGPWLFEAMIDFLHAHSTEEGACFRFDGFFRNYEFVGSIRRLNIAVGKTRLLKLA